MFALLSMCMIGSGCSKNTKNAEKNTNPEIEDVVVEVNKDTQPPSKPDIQKASSKEIKFTSAKEDQFEQTISIEWNPSKDPEDKTPQNELVYMIYLSSQEKATREHFVKNEQLIELNVLEQDQKVAAHTKTVGKTETLVSLLQKTEEDLTSPLYVYALALDKENNISELEVLDVPIPTVNVSKISPFADPKKNEPKSGQPKKNPVGPEKKKKQTVKKNNANSKEDKNAQEVSKVKNEVNARKEESNNEVGRTVPPRGKVLQPELHSDHEKKIEFIGSEFVDKGGFVISNNNITCTGLTWSPPKKDGNDFFDDLSFEIFIKEKSSDDPEKTITKKIEGYAFNSATGVFDVHDAINIPHENFFTFGTTYQVFLETHFRNEEDAKIKSNNAIEFLHNKPVFVQQRGGGSSSRDFINNNSNQTSSRDGEASFDDRDTNGAEIFGLSVEENNDVGTVLTRTEDHKAKKPEDVDKSTGKKYMFVDSNHFSVSHDRSKSEIKIESRFDNAKIAMIQFYDGKTNIILATYAKNETSDSYKLYEAENEMTSQSKTNTNFVGQLKGSLKKKHFKIEIMDAQRKFHTAIINGEPYLESDGHNYDDYGSNVSESKVDSSFAIEANSFRPC